MSAGNSGCVETNQTHVAVFISERNPEHSASSWKCRVWLKDSKTDPWRVVAENGGGLKCAIEKWQDNEWATKLESMKHEYKFLLDLHLSLQNLSISASLENPILSLCKSLKQVVSQLISRPHSEWTPKAWLMRSWVWHSYDIVLRLQVTMDLLIGIARRIDGMI